MMPLSRARNLGIIASLTFATLISPSAASAFPQSLTDTLSNTSLSAMPCYPWGEEPSPMSSTVDDFPVLTGSSEYEPLCGGKTPIFLKGGRLNISAFTISKGPKKYAKGMRYNIERDHAEHGGGYWKLFDRTKRIGTYKQDGTPRKAQP